MISIIALCFVPLVTGLSINGFPPTVTPGEVVTITWFRDTGDPQNWHMEFVQDDNQIIGDIIDPASHAAKSADMTLTVPPEATGVVELLAFSDLADPTFFFTQPISLPTSSVQDSPNPSPGGTTADPTPTAHSTSSPSSSTSKTQSSTTSTNSSRVSDDSTSTSSPPPDSGDDDPDANGDDPDQNQSRHTLTTIIAVTVLGVVLLLVVLAVFLYRRWRHRAGRRAYSAPDYETPSNFHPENMVRMTPNVCEISSSRSELESESSGSDLKGSGSSSYRMHSISTVPVLGRTQSPPYTPSDSNPPTSFDSAEFTTHYSSSVASGRIPR